MGSGFRVAGGASRATERHIWAARMIRPLSDAGVGTRQPFLRNSFQGKSGGKTTLRISALGLYRAFINGKRVGDDLLTPGWTSYYDRLSYQTYDVGDLLSDGDNVIDVWLGDGWYRSQMMWAHEHAILNTWGDRIAAIVELEADGKTILASDTSWSSGLTPILKSGIYFGETYDARLEGAAADQGVALHEDFDPSVLVAHEVNGVKELGALKPASSFTDAEGRTIYDFGQNAAAYLAFTVKGEAGATVLVEHSEILDKGEFCNTNLRSAPCRITYVLKGEGRESYKPTFTFQGFRFVRVTVTGRAEIIDVASVPISSAVTRTGWLTTGHPLVNRLVENSVWSQRSNFVDVPTDCPQRDERLGWTGDAQVFAATACYLHDSHDFFVKWLRDVMADQREDGEIAHVVPDPTRGHEDLYPGFYGSTGWGDAISIVPHALYRHYGDLDILRETLPAMIRWNDFVWSISNGPIVRPPRPWAARGFTFGDWLQPKGPSEKPLPTIGDDAAATIYLFIAAKLTAKIAGLVGDTTNEQRLYERAEAVKAAFAQEFITPSGRLAYDDQTSYALAFLHDLIPEDKRTAAKGYFKATIARSGGRIGTGFIGTPALLPALIKIGEPELAGAVFLQEEVPGWLYQVKNGATTIWERWDAIQADGSVFDPSMNSYNHYAYGAVCQWLFEEVAGLRPDEVEPGFRHIVFEPAIIPALSPVAAAHDVAAGRIEAGWRIDGDTVTWETVVPDGARGTLIVPTEAQNVILDGKPVTSASVQDKQRLAVGSGRHVVTFTVAP
ncbi:family 78 glycoside hydrolase catalytic domain [Pleomorphomonas sp. PLEO]|uniref:family 78 glycoside hydrolase catalytic domain n=1 Tax=Pleomorphomonas sp. PLEO TaxID=3239306 RepID=UPI00351F4EB3